ncbi:MAG TPA: NAD(P)-dependent oxidoreductase [Thermoleophilaceae bacterium]|nr:NAD(P)-dependent oxidoreductase [Thermoleophilaceae bacterium]
MRVFVAGASGALGRPLVPKLVAAGHEVTGMTRSDSKAEAIRRAGARAAVVDVFDADALRGAVEEARPDVIVHELTALPDRIDYRKEDTYAATNRVRTEGTRNLIAAARAAGARRFVCQSIAFAYRMDGHGLKTEDDPLLTEAPGAFGSGVSALREMEEMVLGTDGLDGLVLRYGFFYGPGTYYADDGSSTKDVRRRRLPIVGKGSGVFSFVHVDDAAHATVSAVERGAPGIYNVTDDEPAPMNEWVPVFAEAAGAKPPWRVPVWLSRFVAGKDVSNFAVALRGASNEKAKRELGWEPAHPSWRSGFAESLRA